MIEILPYLYYPLPEIPDSCHFSLSYISGSATSFAVHLSVRPHTHTHTHTHIHTTVSSPCWSTQKIPCSARRPTSSSIAQPPSRSGNESSTTSATSGSSCSPRPTPASLWPPQTTSSWAMTWTLGARAILMLMTISYYAVAVHNYYTACTCMQPSFVSLALYLTHFVARLLIISDCPFTF